MVEALDDLLDQINSLENQIRSVEMELRFSDSLFNEGQTNIPPEEISRIMHQKSAENKAPAIQPIVQKPESAIQANPEIQMNKPKAEIGVGKAEINASVKTEPSKSTEIGSTSKSTEIKGVASAGVQPPQAQQEVVQIPSVQYGAADIPSIAFVIKKLSELIDLNSKISEELQEIISTSSKADASKRLSSLINKLAYASIYG
ncbi:MAG: hypothetical protein QXK90_00470 [Candidatus Parvarchaeota archaeon]